VHTSRHTCPAEDAWSIFASHHDTCYQPPSVYAHPDQIQTNMPPTADCMIIKGVQTLFKKQALHTTNAKPWDAAHGSQQDSLYEVQPNALYAMLQTQTRAMTHTLEAYSRDAELLIYSMQSDKQGCWVLTQAPSTAQPGCHSHTTNSVVKDCQMLRRSACHSMFLSNAHQATKKQASASHCIAAQHQKGMPASILHATSTHIVRAPAARNSSLA
jgi:hypothetical protein